MSAGADSNHSDRKSVGVFLDAGDELWVWGIRRYDLRHETRSLCENPLINLHSTIEFHYFIVKKSPTDFVSEHDPATLNRTTTE
jgi:hypothetical protein